MMTAGALSAQEKSASITATGSATFDFGDIKESAGPASHVFTVMNKVTYNPAGRPGKFVKTISVYSNGKADGGNYVLTIRGNVIQNS